MGFGEALKTYPGRYPHTLHHHTYIHIYSVAQGRIDIGCSDISVYIVWVSSVVCASYKYGTAELPQLHHTGLENKVWFTLATSTGSLPYTLNYCKMATFEVNELMCICD